MTFRPYFTATADPIVVVTKTICFESKEDAELALQKYSKLHLEAIFLGWCLLPIGENICPHFFQREFVIFELDVEPETVRIKKMSVIYRAPSIG
jgi:hypothetical protein